MSTYKASRRDVAIADEAPPTTVLQCTFCHVLTPVDDLNTYGARCYACYREYCSQGRHFPSLTRDDRRDMAQRVSKALAGGLRASSRDHIRSLEAKEADGAATAGQRGFLAAVRSALKAPADG